MHRLLLVPLLLAGAGCRGKTELAWKQLAPYDVEIEVPADVRLESSGDPAEPQIKIHGGGFMVFVLPVNQFMGAGNFADTVIALQGDATSFTRQDEVPGGWRIEYETGAGKLGFAYRLTIAGRALDCEVHDRPAAATHAAKRACESMRALGDGAGVTPR